jgi:hypothetical protein
VVARARGKLDRDSEFRHLAQAKIGVSEPPTEQVGAVRLRVGSVGVRGKGSGLGGGLLEVEEGVGVVVKGIADPGRGSVNYVDPEAAIVVEARA